MDRLWIVKMFFSTTSIFVLSDAVKCQIFSVQADQMPLNDGHLIFCNIFNCDTTDTADCVCKILVNDFLFETDCLKDLDSLIRLDCGNTHLGCDLYDSAEDTLHCYNHQLLHNNLCEAYCINQLMDGFMCKIRVDRTCTITEAVLQNDVLLLVLPLSRSLQQMYSSLSYQMLLQADTARSDGIATWLFIHSSV